MKRFLSALLSLSTTLVLCQSVGISASSAATPSWKDSEIGHQAFGSTSITSISCVLTTFCVAGGNHSEAYLYNGSNWSATDVINNPEIPRAGVNSIKCISTTFCVAGGSEGAANSGNLAAFVSVYNGNNWTSRVIATSLDEVPNPSDGVNDVTCVTSTFCVAVGSYSNSEYGRNAFVSVYNGISWSDSQLTTHNKECWT